MIRKLRFKFVLINMCIVTLMLFVIFGLVIYFTSADLESESIRMMQSIALQPFQLGMPDEQGEQVRLPFFTIQLGMQGEVVATGGGYYDLSDRAFLNTLIEQAFSSPRPLGVIEAYNLRYYRVDTPVNHCLVFADISSEVATLNGLIRSCLLIGMVSFLLFLWASVLLSRWAVAPVERAWKQQRQFVADASHELKTPLTVILTNAELAQGDGDDPAARGRLLAGIAAMAQQMKELLEQMLALARADQEPAAAAFRPVDLSRLTADTLLPFEPVFFEAGLTLESRIEPGICLSGEEAQLRQLLEILLDNACKYAQPRGRVWVTLERRGRNRCLLAVADEGEPIPPEELENLFKRFYRADPARRRTGSYGLGLAIAQAIVARHRGRIRAESRQGVNTFSAELPLG